MAIQTQLFSSENHNNNIGFVPSMDKVNNGTSCGVGVGSGGFNHYYFNIMQKNQQQLQKLQQHQLQQQRNQNQSQNMCFDDNSCVNSMPLSQSIAFEVEKQRLEIDQYLRSQNERLRLLLQQQRKQQVEMMVKKIESRASVIMRHKEEEIAKATNRTMELEILLKKMEMENQAWQRMAHENEAMVISLSNTLEQLERSGSCYLNNNNGGAGGEEAEDAESCCNLEEKTGEEDEEQQQRTRKMMMVCRGCNSRDSCVLFLPCRHLCSCKTCEAVLDSCPVCFIPKKASIEALIS